MYLLLLFMYLGAIICTNQKIHFFEKHTHVLERVEISPCHPVIQHDKICIIDSVINMTKYATLILKTLRQK